MELRYFLGTLNIELEMPYIMETNEKILPEEYGGQYNVLVKEAKFLNHKVYVLRPELNNKEGGQHSLNIIEIVSDVCFREKYNLKDGDEVSIEIE